MSPTTITDGVEGLAAKIGVFYRDGKINLGAPLYAFTPAELAEFARRLRPQVDEAMVKRLRKILKDRWGIHFGVESARAALTAALNPEADRG